MRLLETIAEILAPTRCAGCELPGKLLCPSCAQRAFRFSADESCPRCGAPFGALVCTECWECEFAFEAALSLGELARPLSRAVVLHKDAGERRLGEVLGRRLGECVAEQWGPWPSVVTWIPPTRDALRRRGFDHGFALAKPVAEALGVPAEPLLVRDRAHDQRALGRGARALNAAGSFQVSGKTASHVLIVDDVLTTGATLDTASALLLEAGAADVRVAVVARAW